MDCYGINENGAYQFGIGLNTQNTSGDNEWPIAVRQSPDNQWHTISGTLTVPEGHVRARVFLQINGTSNFNRWRFTNVIVRRAITGELIVDGAIDGKIIRGAKIIAYGSDTEDVYNAEVKIGYSESSPPISIISTKNTYKKTNLSSFGMNVYANEDEYKEIYAYYNTDLFMNDSSRKCYISPQVLEFGPAQGSSDTLFTYNEMRAYDGDFSFNIMGNAYFKSPNSPYGVTIASGDSNINLLGTYNDPRTQGANMCITSDGWIHRSTSASKYKVGIESIDTTNEYVERILQINPKSWHDKNEMKAISSVIDGTDDHGYKPYFQRYYGLIAEDLIDAGLSEFVTYGEADAYGNREPEGIEYDRLWTLLIPIVRHMKNEYEFRINALEKDKDNLLLRLSQIESKLLTN